MIFSIVNVQRDEENSFIIRLEHWQQSYAQSQPAAVDLQKMFPDIQIVSVAEYYLSKLFSSNLDVTVSLRTTRVFGLSDPAPDRDRYCLRWPVSS